MEQAELRKLTADYTAAWNSGLSAAVASFFAADGEIVINRGEPWSGRQRVQAMADGFFADVPDLSLICDDARASGNHVVYVWTFTGHHAQTKRPLKIRGWEEWDLDGEGKVKASRGWFDAEEYARQAGA